MPKVVAAPGHGHVAACCSMGVQGRDRRSEVQSRLDGAGWCSFRDESWRREWCPDGQQAGAAHGGVGRALPFIVSGVDFAISVLTKGESLRVMEPSKKGETKGASVRRREPMSRHAVSVPVFWSSMHVPMFPCSSPRVVPSPMGFCECIVPLRPQPGTKRRALGGEFQYSTIGGAVHLLVAAFIRHQKAKLLVARQDGQIETGLPSACPGFHRIGLAGRLMLMMARAALERVFWAPKPTKGWKRKKLQNMRRLLWRIRCAFSHGPGVAGFMFGFPDGGDGEQAGVG